MSIVARTTMNTSTANGSWPIYIEKPPPWVSNWFLAKRWPYDLDPTHEVLFLESGQQVARTFHAVALGAEALCVFDKVRVLEVDVTWPAEVAQLMPGDQP